MKLATEPFEISRGARLYIRRADSMTGILIRTHVTDTDTSTVRFRPSSKCDIKIRRPQGQGITLASRQRHMRCVGKRALIGLDQVFAVTTKKTALR